LITGKPTLRKVSTGCSNLKCGNKSLKALIETDSDLITLRKRITVSAESKYENGTITATEYLNELNSEKQALINLEVHRINLSMARIEYLNISGKEIE